MERKDFALTETTADDDTGWFEAVVSTFNNVDRVKDRILPGAYAKTLAEWRESGDPIPVIFSHDWASPFAHIGVINPYEAHEVTKGLKVKGQLDIDDNELARQVHKLLKRRSLKEFSIGYNVPKGGERKRNGVNEISEIKLIECGPCLKGVDPNTELHAVKSALDTLTAPGSRPAPRPRVVVPSGPPPSDAILKARAKSLGIDIPMTEEELRRSSEQVALSVALGADKAPKLEPDADTGPTQAGLRRKSDRARLDMIVDDAELSKPTTITFDAKAVRDEWRTHTLNLMKVA